MYEACIMSYSVSFIVAFITAQIILAQDYTK